MNSRVELEQQAPELKVNRWVELEQKNSIIDTCLDKWFILIGEWFGTSVLTKAAMSVG